MESLCTIHTMVKAFMVRDVMVLNSIFSIFPLAEYQHSVLYDRNFTISFNS